MLKLWRNEVTGPKVFVSRNAPTFSQTFNYWRQKPFHMRGDETTISWLEETTNQTETIFKSYCTFKSMWCWVTRSSRLWRWQNRMTFIATSLFRRQRLLTRFTLTTPQSSQQSCSLQKQTAARYRQQHRDTNKVTSAYLLVYLVVNRKGWGTNSS